MCASKMCIKLDGAFKNFFRGNAYPRFRRKGEHESYTTNNTLNEYKNIKYESIRIDLKNKVITLPKLKKVKFRGYRNIKKIKSATISKDAKKYFVSVLIETLFTKPTINPTSILGLD